MVFVDLSHIVSPRMPVYPGSDPPVFESSSSIAEQGYVESKIVFYSHVGTHLDAPAHVIEGAKTLDQYPVDQFFGKGCVVPITARRDRMISLDSLKPFEKAIAQSDFLLLNTDWSRFWGSDHYFGGFPVLSLEAAAWLGGFGLKGLGVDAISVDRTGARDLPVHNLLLRQDTIIIENLTGLTTLEAGDFFFSCFPIRFEQADGSPTRAVAICQSKISL